MSDRPIFSFLTDEDVFHCENDSPVDMKIYISQLRLEYQGDLDMAREQLKTINAALIRDNKEKRRYQNALLLITSFDRYPEQTALEIQMFNTAGMALGGNTQADIDAVQYWVDQCDKRDDEISRLSSMLKDIVEKLARAPNTNNYDWEKWRVEFVIKNKPKASK